MTDVATKNWYIVHTYSGFEKKVAESLTERVKAYGLQNDIGEVLIPTEDVVEMRSGRKVVTPKRFFPGYILVEMHMSDNAWHVVKNTPKVTGFVGAGSKPTPLSKEEVDQILDQVKTAAEKPKPKYSFDKGDHVRSGGKRQIRGKNGNDAARHDRHAENKIGSEPEYPRCVLGQRHVLGHELPDVPVGLEQARRRSAL